MSTYTLEMKAFILAFAFSLPLLFSCNKDTKDLPRVVITTDINIGGGDPDDKQSLIHLFWYANELDIEGIIPDSWGRQGYEASITGLNAYAQDYTRFGFQQKGYPHPDTLKNRIARNQQEAIEMLRQEALAKESPLYVLVWGQMTTLKEALYQYPEIAARIRVLTIGTGRKYGPKDEVKGEDCNVVNWNGRGRNEIYEDARFNHMWWVESNWTYNGMFGGQEARDMLDSLHVFGSMGKHFKNVTKGYDWAQYFRAGDTPSVLYVIDPQNRRNDPTHGSWAGIFAQPFPQDKPNYYTDHAGTIAWDYQDPCKSWDQVEAMYAYNKSTLAERRPEMYTALLKKLRAIYGK